MYASVASLVLLGLSLAWTALNKSGVTPFAWYISLLLIGLAQIAFWARPRRLLCPPFPNWLSWTIRGTLLYTVFQAIPLPLPLLALLSPARAEATRTLAPISGPVSFAPISVDPAAHILWLLTLAGCAAAFFLMRNLTFRFQNRLVLALVPLLAVASFEALLGLLQVASGAVQAVGSYNSRDHYCCILEMTMPLFIVLGFVLFSRKPLAPSIWPAVTAGLCWLLAGLLMLGILFSLSRAGWLDSFVSLVVLATFILFPRTSSNTWRIGILASLLLSFSAVFLIASPGAMLSRLAGSVGNDSSGRLYIWRQLVPLLTQFRWFGTGLMGFDPVFLKYQNFVNDKRIDFAHNDFLQYLIELGLVGFLPLMISLGAILWPVLKKSWVDLTPASSRAELRLLLLGCVASFVALFLHSLVDFNLYIPANLFAFAWILGFASALASIFDVKSKTSLPTAEN